MTLRFAACVTVLFALLCSGARGHETTRSYLTLTRDGAAVDVSLRMAFRDIEVVVWADEDLDGRITWGEATRRLDAIATYVGAAVLLDAGGPCALTRTEADASVSGGIAYLDLGFDALCPDAAAPLTVTSRLFTDIDPDHRQFLTALTGGATTTTVLTASNPAVTLTGGTGGAAGSFAAYFRAGVEHLVGGPDHLVFLLVLMLPAVCNGSGPRKAALGVLAAVTGFTLAHALTLTAAATELLRPPTRVIEVLIALSIVVTAADNLRPFIPAPRAAVAAFFGLVHGFGFATALGVLQLTGVELATALVGFNLGVEAAQVAVVLVTVPALYMLGGGRLVLWVGSLAAGATGLYWVGQRLAG
jgi:hypothetical protein